MHLPEATKLPLKADEVGEYTTTAIYSLTGLPGIYRRVSRGGRVGLRPAPGNVLALLANTIAEDISLHQLAEMKRWREAEELLRPLLPGVESPYPHQEEDPLRGTDPQREDAAAT